MIESRAFEELRALRTEVAALAAVVMRLVPAQSSCLAPADRRVLDALAEVFGIGCPFSSRELVAACGARIGARPELRAALLVATGGTLDAQSVGLALRRISQRCEGAPLRLAAPRTEGGRRLWVVEGLSPPKPTAPHCLRP